MAAKLPTAGNPARTPAHHLSRLRANCLLFDSAQTLLKPLLSHGELGKRLGKTQVSVTETLQVLNLPPQIQQEALSLERGGGRPISKSLLLEIVRRPPSEQHRLWDAAKRGELTVKMVRAERDRVKKVSVKNHQRRASKPFRYPIALIQNNAVVTIEFPEGNPRLEDVVSALEEALAFEQVRITR